MAILEPGFFFTGTLSNITAYKMKGTGKIVLRSKGGPDKKQIKTSPRFERTRENISEFSGRSVAARLLRRAMGDLRWFADHNLVNSLQPILRKIQQLDTTGARGQRNISLRLAPGLLTGYNLNRMTQLESVVRSPLAGTISAESRSATLTLPALVPGINFFPHRYHPYFRIAVALGAMPDVQYSPHGYAAPPAYDQYQAVSVHTPWLLARNGCAEQSLELQLPPCPGEARALVLTAGICFGSIAEEGTVRQERYSGLAKVVGVV